MNKHILMILVLMTNIFGFSCSDSKIPPVLKLVNSHWSGPSDLIDLDSRALLFVYNRTKQYDVILYDKVIEQFHSLCFLQDVFAYDLVKSPCSTYLACAISDSNSLNTSQIAIYNTKSGKLNIIGPPGTICASPSFSPTSSRVLFSCLVNNEHYNIYEYIMSEGVLTQLTEGNFFDTNPFYIRDDSILFWRASRFGYSIGANRWHDWQLFRMDRIGNLEVLSRQYYSKPHFVLSPNKSYILYSDNCFYPPSEYYLLNLNTMEEIFPLSLLMQKHDDDEFTAATKHFHLPAISPCSQFVCVALGETTPQDYGWNADIYVVDVNTLSGRWITNVSSSPTEIHFSYDGKFIYYVLRATPHILWRVSLGTLTTVEIEIPGVFPGILGTVTYY